MTKNLAKVADAIESEATELDQLDADMELETIEGETKNEAFLRLVNKRLPVAVKRLRLIGNLTSPNYAYTPEQAAAVLNVLRAELDKLEAQFSKEEVADDIPTIS